MKVENRKTKYNCKFMGTHHRSKKKKILNFWSSFIFHIMSSLPSIHHFALNFANLLFHLVCLSFHLSLSNIFKCEFSFSFFFKRKNIPIMLLRINEKIIFLWIDIYAGLMLCDFNALKAEWQVFVICLSSNWCSGVIGSADFLKRIIENEMEFYLISMFPTLLI